MLLISIPLKFDSSFNKDTIIHFIKGRTEEIEDRKHIIPAMVYDFFKGKFKDNNFKMSFYYNLTDYEIHGQVVEKQDGSTLNLKVRLSKTSNLITSAVLLFILGNLIFNYFDQFYFFGTLIVLWVFFNLSIAFYKIRNIFKNISQNAIPEKNMKYQYIN